ncbi:MAG: hypothetical protein A2Z72_03545 [Omnitrophica bacterium RBG_13_46_9]|nr:MAG: hypothetical protein A2Z72_03545 [Omnitrophica bacterium RBG_13_46_9]
MDYKTANIAVIVCLIVAGFVIYGNSVGNSFVYDDNPLIADNPFIKTFDNIGKLFLVDLHFFGSAKNLTKIKYYRPVVALSFVVDYFLWGLEAFGYHLTNISIHICNAVLIFFLACVLSGDRRIGVIASFLFLVHPINTEAVTYISGRGDPLSLFFGLSSFLLFLRHLKEYKNTFSTLNLSSAFLFMIALLTRESNALFFLVFPSYVYIYSKERITKEGFKVFYALLPHITVLAIFILFRYAVLGVLISEGLAPDPLAVRLMTLPRVIVLYMGMLLFPHNLHMNRTLAPVQTLFSPLFLIPFTILLFISVLIVRMSKNDALIRFSAVWVAVNFLPFSSVVFPLSTYVAEHWIYIPLVGISIIAAGSMTRFFDGIRDYKPVKYLATIILAAVIVSYSIATVRQNRNWKDAETFYTWIDRFEKTDYRVSSNLGALRLQEKRYDEALDLYKKALSNIPESGLSTDLGRQHFSLIYKGLGDAYVGKGDRDTAITYYEKAVEINPRFGDAYNDLGNCYLRQGREKQAIEAYEMCIKFSPYNWTPYANLGSYYMNKGELKKSKYYWGKVLEMSPGFEPAIKSLGVIRKRLIE